MKEKNEKIEKKNPNINQEWESTWTNLPNRLFKKQTKRGEMIESPRRNMLLNLKGVNAN